jgi:hypothetical protein
LNIKLPSALAVDHLDQSCTISAHATMTGLVVVTLAVCLLRAYIA